MVSGGLQEQLSAAPAVVGRLIEKDHPFNIDAQDAQDNQEVTLLQGKPTRVKRDAGCPQSGKAVEDGNPLHPVHPCK